MNFTALSMTKKLFKKTVSKQTAEQSVKNDQLSVQMSISSKMSKKLTQFFASEFSKTSDNFKIKLEAFTFNRSESLSNESDQSDNHQKVNSDDEDEISDEVKEVLKIIKKWVKNFMKKSADDSSNSDSFSNSDESDHWFCKKHSKHHHCCYEMNSDSDSDFDISLKYQKVKILSLKSSDDYIIWKSSMKIVLMQESTLKLVQSKLQKFKKDDKIHHKW